MSKTADPLKDLITYKKNFPLGKDLTFLHYIEVIDNIDFSPYVLVIEKTPKDDEYLAEIIYAPSAFLIAQPGYGIADLFVRPILLNKCTIKYSEEPRVISFEAFPDSDLYLLVLFFGLLLICLCGFMAAYTGALLVLLPVPIILLLSFSVYHRDIRRLDTLGKLAMKTTETKGK